jgi:hypothetical protein
MRKWVLIPLSAIMLFLGTQAYRAYRPADPQSSVCMPFYSNEEFERLYTEFRRAVSGDDGKVDKAKLKNALIKMRYTGPGLTAEGIEDYTFANDGCADTEIYLSRVSGEPGVERWKKKAWVSAGRAEEFLKKHKQE